MNDTLDNSLNSDLVADFETNLNNIAKISEENYDYATLIELLQSDKIEEKQIAALKLTEIKSKNDAKILVSNLVGQDGKVREAVAFKINEFTQNPTFSEFFNDKAIFEILLQGILDINGNVCRQIVELHFASDFGQCFRLYLCDKLPEMLNEILEEIKKIDSQSRQYVISKRNFQLYWALEALYNIIDIIELGKVKSILLSAGVFYDYTIREKIAKILAKIDSNELLELNHLINLKMQLKNDENYYVRRYLI